MKHWTMIAAGAAALAACGTVEPPMVGTVSVPIALAEGQAYEMLVTTESERARGPGGIDRHQTLSRIEVSGRLGDGWLMTETVKDWDFSRVQEPMGTMMDTLARGFAGETYEIEADQFGAPVRLRDWRPVVRAAFDQAAALIDPVAAERLGHLPVSTQQAAREQVGTMIGRLGDQYLAMRDDTAAIVLAENMWLWAFPAGLEIGPKPIGGPVEIPSPLGGPPLSGTETVRLVSLDPDGTALIQRVQTVDEGGMHALTARVVETMQVPGNQMDAVRSEIARTDMRVSFEQDFITDVNTGLTSRIEQRKRVEIGPAGRSREDKVIEIRRIR